MQSKWCFSTLIIILILFGLGQHHISAPNQEIVLQFTDDEVTSDVAYEAIEVVKNQLQIIGVDNIQVHEEEDGSLKIKYYSNISVVSIKEILSNENTPILGFATYDHDEDEQLPSDENSSSYNFDVLEIRKSSDSEWDYEGTFVLELKLEGDRFSSPKVFTCIDKVIIKHNIESIAYKLNKNIAVAIDNSSHNIPEVRAGPIA